MNHRLKAPVTLLVMIFRSALDVIRRESQRSGKVETGGTLIGVDDGRMILVTHATAPGEGARHQSACFQADVPYQQEQLNQTNTQFGCVGYVGEWHKHPSGMTRPSAGDQGGVRDILADPDYGVSRLLFPIVTCDRQSGFAVHPYLMSHDEEEFERVRWRDLPFWLSPDRCFIRDSSHLFHRLRPNRVDPPEELDWRESHRKGGFDNV